ncbi:MAG: response regulator [Phycisphaerales bacterium JB039]
MSERTTLLVVSEPAALADPVAAALREHFDVRLVSEAEALEAEAAGERRILRLGARSPGDDPSGLLDWIGEGVCLCAEGGQVVWRNSVFAALPGAVRQRAIQIAWEQAGAARPEVSREIEVDVDGASLWYELTIPQRSAEATTVPLVIRDVTASRRLARKMDAIDQAGRELARIDAEAIQRRNALERLGLLETKIVQFAHDLLRFDHFAVRLINEKTGKLELVISAGLSDEAAELDLRPALKGNGIAGYVAATGRSVLCTDSTQDERFLPCLADARSSVCVPLRLHDRVIGVLDAESLSPGAFTEEDRRLAEIFARHVALALHILDLLVIERSTTNLNVSGRVEGELAEPLADIVREIETLRQLQSDPAVGEHLERIAADVESIRARVREVGAGPQTLLGVERALASQRQEPWLVGRRVLVADDEPKIRRVIADVLRNRGASVVTCASGAEAIAEFAKASSREAPFDLVVSDIKMPDRNGYEVFAAARRTMPGAPVILMTGFGYDPSHSIVRASQEGLQSVLFKPFQVDRLLAEARKALEGPEAPPQAGT